MSNETIAVDVDDVLSAENDAMREFINERYSVNLTPEDYKVEGPFWGYWERVWGVDGDEGRRRYKTYLESGIQARHAVVEGAVETLSKLNQKYDLVVVTSRDDSLIDITHEWLDRHFPKVFKQAAFMAVWSGDKKATKAVICQEIGANYLVDDSLEHCSLAAEAGITALLFGEYGWNHAEQLPPHVIRMAGWQAVAEYFGV